MNWFCVVVLGFATGYLGKIWHPFGKKSQLPTWFVLLIAILLMACIKMLGAITGLFFDGELLEWPVCVGLTSLILAIILRFF